VNRQQAGCTFVTVCKYTPGQHEKQAILLLSLELHSRVAADDGEIIVAQLDPCNIAVEGLPTAR
jgi:hypothetical protein